MSKIVFIGDSITKGVRDGVTEVDTFVYKVSTARGFSQYINKGVPNDTADGGLARFKVDVLDNNPKICVIMFGTNDVFYGKPISLYKSSIKNMIQQCKVANIEVVILTPFFGRSSPQINTMPSYLRALYELSKEERVPLIEIYKEVTHDYFTMSSASWSGMYVDWAHPSASGHTYITNRILDPLNANLLLP